MRVEYSKDMDVAFFNGIKFRKDKKTGYYLAGKPTNGKKRERLHCYVWRFYNGDIPDGYHVHHKNENKDCNDIENLVCMTQKEHMVLHSNEYAKNHRDSLVQNLIDNARPKASEWHRSETGRAWHSKQAKKNASEMKLKEFVCEFCGKLFFKKPLGQNKFCSNNCKSAWRRKNGVDDETRKCFFCGKEFRVNKYATTKYCSTECRNVVVKNKKREKNRDRTGL